MDREGGKVHQLNTVASIVWDRCDGSSSIQAIVDRLVAEFDVEREAALKDVEALLQEFVGLGLLDTGGREPQHTTGSTRGV